MSQRRVVIADHDPQGAPRLTETMVSAGQALYERKGFSIRWRQLEPKAALFAPSGQHQFLIVVITGQLAAPGAESLTAGDSLITSDPTVLRAIDGPVGLMIVTVGLDDSAAPRNPLTVADPGTLGSGVRRVVLTGAGDKVQVRQDGEPPNAVRHRDSINATQVWQTGGPLHSVDDGGDVPGAFRNGPQPGGVMLQSVQLNPVGYQPAEHDWHATPTVDFDVVVAGQLELSLPGHSTLLQPGDIVVQRGTEHAWLPRGDQPVRLLAVMIEPSDQAQGTQPLSPREA